MTNIPATLVAWSRRAPHKPFMEEYDDGDGIVRRVSFGELGAMMLSAASHLSRDSGLGPGDICAMFAPNSVAYAAASLGAMALGASSFHLNTRQPVDVTRVLLVELAPKVLCCARPPPVELMPSAAEGDGATPPRLVLLADILMQRTSGSTLDARHSEALASSIASIDGARVAVIFTTGGTTGTPKVVPHTHEGLLWLSAQLQRVSPEPYAEEVCRADMPRAELVCRARRLLCRSCACA